MQLSTGFWASKTLAAATELDLFTRLSGTKGTTAGELAAALGIAERPAEMLPTGCAALGLLTGKAGRYRNSPLAEEFLVRGKPYWSEEENRHILRKCFDALPRGGMIVICELLVNDDKTGPVSGALMSLNMLIETAGGRNYTATEYGTWLRDIGFRKTRTVRFKSPGGPTAR